MTDLFPRIEQHATRRADERGHIDILYESDHAVLKRTWSRAGALRGVHWQDETAPQVKLFRVTSGRIADFIVPMDDPARPLLHEDFTPADGWVRIDARFAHGFYAYVDSVFEYFCDGGYDEAAEMGFDIADRVAMIVGVDRVIQSAKDAAMPPLTPVIQEAGGR